MDYAIIKLDWVSQQLWQPDSQRRESTEDNDSYKHANHHWSNTLEDPLQRHVFGYTGNNVYVHANRGSNQAHLHNHDHQYSIPDLIKAQALHDRQEDRYSKHDHGKRVHQAPHNCIDHDDYS